MQTEINLTDRQQEVMITAAVDHDGHLEPAAASLGIRGGAFTNMMNSLRSAELVGGEDAETRLTPAGYAAISVDAPAEQDAPTEQEVPTEQDAQNGPEIEEASGDAAPETEAEAGQEASSETATEPELEPETEVAPEPETPIKKPRQPRTGTKQATVIEMLKRSEGASLQQIMDATGWQMHTTRAVLSRTIQKDLGIPLTSEKTSGGDRIYRIA